MSERVADSWRGVERAIVEIVVYCEVGVYCLGAVMDVCGD